MDTSFYLPDLIWFSQGPTDTQEAGFQIRTHLQACVEEMRQLFGGAAEAQAAAGPSPKAIAEQILRVLLSHEFNYQSRGRLAHLVPDLLAGFERVIGSGRKLPVYFLFHGGYRAKVGGPALAHTFAPDITELLLIQQVARLERRIRAIYPPGVRFAIVINNGVAAHTNGIPYALTSGYVRGLRRLIARLGADQTVWVLEQAELGDFGAKMHAVEVVPKAQIDPVDHGVVERFLGRTCSSEEACLRLATYERAEGVWGAEIRAIVAAQDGFFCRQVAHPACLSFRPFPGGAIRVQNGSVGFRIGASGPVPAFVTPLTWERVQPIVLPLQLDVFDDITPQQDDIAEPGRQSA